MQLRLIRTALYSVLFLFSLVLLGLAAFRLWYTTHLPAGDPLNGGKNFYDPIVTEIVVASILTALWSAYAIHVIHGLREHRRASTFLAETVALAILWVFYIVGATRSTSIWGDLSYCWEYRACRVLTVMLAFAWMGWILLTILLALCLMIALANKAFGEHFHGRWDPRESNYV